MNPALATVTRTVPVTAPAGVALPSATARLSQAISFGWRLLTRAFPSLPPAPPERNQQDESSAPERRMNMRWLASLIPRPAESWTAARGDRRIWQEPPDARA